MPTELNFYNTLTHRVETFAPIEPPRVLMYNCGPTVYDFAHIGNFRAFVFADVLRRFLEMVGYDVKQVMNITDVGHMTDDQLADGGGEDKMVAAAKRVKEAKKQGTLTTDQIDNPDDPYQVAKFYTNAFLEDARKLGLKIADEYPEHMPRATGFIAQMQRLISRLIDKGHAYESPAGGTVYFSVESFPEYGRLSGNTLDKLRGGAGGRVLDEHQAGKRHPADFLLWKADSSHVMKWESPWGVGYPGWHIECSAMSLAVLSKLAGQEVTTIDIHTGGEDNIFPHHECEIAQSCGSTGSSSFARLWMHTRFLLVEGQKMSKSKGNFYTVRDVLEGKATGRPVDPAVLRYELLRSHYRSNMNFTAKGLEDSAGAVAKLRDYTQRWEQEVNGQSVEVDPQHPMLADFTRALSDDLSISGGIGALFTWAAGKHPDPAQSLAALRAVDGVLGVLGSASAPTDDSAELCRQLDAARAAKDFAKADAIRRQLQDAGYEVMTTKAGTTAKKKLA
ncbi:MAG: cysteine--tRNA ligase [Phycisphaera sp.]|nr:cysteine--tRNA ligase [Phycisphaera sp.]